MLLPAIRSYPRSLRSPPKTARLVFRPKKPTRVAAPSPRASLGRRTICGRTEQRRPPVSKRHETKVRMVWGSFLIAAAALKTPTRNGYNAQGVNLTFYMRVGRCCSANSTRSSSNGPSSHCESATWLRPARSSPTWHSCTSILTRPSSTTRYGLYTVYTEYTQRIYANPKRVCACVCIISRAHWGTVTVVFKFAFGGLPWGWIHAGRATTLYACMIVPTWKYPQESGYIFSSSRTFQGEEPLDTAGGRVFLPRCLFWSSGHSPAPVAPGRFVRAALSFCGVSCVL